jgi:hypothetical protein
MLEPEVIIRAELAPTEQLLWVGPARTGLVMRPGDWARTVFGLLWCGVVGVMMGMIIAEGGPQTWFAVSLLSVFLALGLTCVAGPPLRDARRRARTFYGVSGGRVIIVSLVRSSRVVRSMHLDAQAEISLTERADGSGTIRLGPEPSWYYWYAGWDRLLLGGSEVAQLELAGDARRVYDIVLSARRALKQTGPRAEG